MDNILLNTKDNMVFCINSSTFSQFQDQIDKKSCSVVNCSTNWIDSRRKIYEKTKECIDGECASIKKFDYDYVCYDVCPKGTYPNKYICGPSSYLSNDTLCDLRQHFLNADCQRDLNDTLTKRKFIEETKRNLINGELYDLITKVYNDKENFTIKLENEVFQIYGLSNKKRDESLTYINFDECVYILRKRYNLNPKDEIIVFKIEYKDAIFKIPIIEYILISALKTIKLNLEYCRNIKLKYYIPKEINDFEDYKYNPLNKFYTDKCFPFNINNLDIILYDRRKEFDKNNMSLCESMCKFKGYKDNLIECECSIKNKFNSYLNNNTNKYNLIYRFNDDLSDFSFNIWVMQCFSSFLTSENFVSNKCALIIFGIIFLNIIGAFLFKYIEYKCILKQIYIIFESSKKFKSIKDYDKNYNKEELKIKNNQIFQEKAPSKNNNKTIFFKKMSRLRANSSFSNSNNDSKIKLNSLKINTNILKRKTLASKNNKVSENILMSHQINKDIFKDKKIVKDYFANTDYELNSLDYKEALSYDKRNFCAYYFSLIRRHQLLAFIFIPKNDHNSHIIKICFFFFMVALCLVLNVLFIDDAIIHHIYINKGKFDILFIFTKVVYATIITYFLKIILTPIISSEKLFLSLKKTKHKKLVSHLGIKFVIFFFLTTLLLFIFWIYLISFFGVYQKMQIFVLEISGFSFSVILILPFIIP